MIRGVHCIIAENDNNTVIINNKQYLCNPLTVVQYSKSHTDQTVSSVMYLHVSMPTPFHKCSCVLTVAILPHVDHTLCIRQSETEQVQRSSRHASCVVLLGSRAEQQECSYS